MSIPTDDERAFLHELEGEVKVELAEAEAEPIEDADGTPTQEWLMDPYAERYEVSLRTLLGAIEAVEETGTVPSQDPLS